MRTLRRLIALAGIRPGRVVVSVLLGVLAIGFGVGLMTTAGYLISRAAEHPPILSLTIAIVAVRFFGLAKPVARYFDRLFSHDLALRALGTVRARFYGAIEPLAPGQLANFRSDELLSRMVTDVDGLQGLYLRALTPPAVALIVGSACVGTATLMAPEAGVVLAAGLIAAGVFVPAIAGRLGRSVGRHQAAARAKLTSELVELLRGAPEVVAFGQEQATIARIRDADAVLHRLSRRDAAVAGLVDASAIIVTGLTVTGVLAVGVAAHNAGSLAPILIATLALLALASFESVATLPGAARALSATRAEGERVLEVIDRTAAIRDPVTPLDAPSERPSVSLRGVTARYETDEEPAIANFDLDLAPGSRVALVGPSGAGKTTVTNLLLRFLDPEHGSVEIDGHDAREYRQADVRRTFAIAGQKAHVFDSTIRANLELARPGSSEAKLNDALDRAKLGSWVASLPNGLDTLVGEDGAQLSGGQRQRLTVARALLADAPILVLDEPAAHLDSDTAGELMRDIFGAAGDRSILLITHREEGLDLVDEAIEMDGGHRLPTNATPG